MLLIPSRLSTYYLCFYVSDTSTTVTYTLSLHDALPICAGAGGGAGSGVPDQAPELEAEPGLAAPGQELALGDRAGTDRKSTRLNSSHEWISYAVFCLKKKNKK